MFETQRVHMIVHGRVQGVFYRDSTRRKAAELHLMGMVRNLSDGSVEIVAEGRREELEELVNWAHRGPPSASVSRVDVAWEAPRGEFVSFNIHFGS